ncbi:MAG: phenylacetate--CoA ligase family protein [Alphaproteobacteria bacterium]|nr:phenylacetate--CoA ligase family protein [Alphaproteobacteria bacterium]
MTLSPSSELLPIPKSRAEIAAIQRRQMRLAVEKARRAPFWKGRLDHVRLDRLDDPEEWAKIPILHKDALRAMTVEAFYSDFRICRPEEVCEFWRSGGATGKPLFYARTFEDIRYCMVGFTRTYLCTGTLAGNTAHLSFPLGIHPAGHMWARAGREEGIGMVWAGAGAATPSALQLELIRTMKPSLWMGMSSYALHLANLAEASGIDLAAGSVERILTTAEPISAAKRAKIEREWGARLFDCFGMTECSMMGAESPLNEGFHIWTDLAHIEVVDPETWKPVPDGTPGTLLVTPLYTNNATPFIRWNSGDIVIRQSEGRNDGLFGVFPLIRHAHRTAGFFKVRGVNINHQEFEDFLFANTAVNDFKAEAMADAKGIDGLRLSVEIKRGADSAATTAAIVAATKATFELTPEVVVIAVGTLAKEFESSVKAPRFVDTRG